MTGNRSARAEWRFGLDTSLSDPFDVWVFQSSTAHFAFATGFAGAENTLYFAPVSLCCGVRIARRVPESEVFTCAACYQRAESGLTLEWSGVGGWWQPWRRFKHRVEGAVGGEPLGAALTTCEMREQVQEWADEVRQGVDEQD